MSWTIVLIKTRCYFWSLITICTSTLNYLITDHYHKHYQPLGFISAVWKTGYTNKRIHLQNLKRNSRSTGCGVVWHFGSSKEVQVQYFITKSSLRWVGWTSHLSRNRTAKVQLFLQTSQITRSKDYTAFKLYFPK